MPKLSGEAYRKIRLCVDTFDKGVMTGRYTPPGRQDYREFHSLVQFLVETEQIMDEAKFPQSYTAKRTFSPLPAWNAGESAASSGAGKGKRATFEIRLLFRQHASWQGTVTWVEGKGEESFRSVLELILLLDSALSKGGEA